MFFLPISLAFFILFLLLIPLLILLAPAVAFAKLGLDPLLGTLFFVLCLFGSGVNIPVKRERSVVMPAMDEFSAAFMRFFGIRMPAVRERVIAVNLGGAVLPGALSLYLLAGTPVGEVLPALAVTTVVAYLLSRPVRGVGIIMPAFIPPIVAAAAALLFSAAHAPQVAYISGVLGTLFGADLLRLGQIKTLEAPFVSIGGAGVFDGIFLVGIVSVLLA